MKTLRRLFLAAVLGLLAMPGRSWAGPIWSLQWEFGTNVLISDSGRSLVTFTPAPATFSTKKNATALVAHVGVASYLPPWRSDPITHQNYGALLKLTDLASRASHLFWFSGSLTGRISQHWAYLTNHFNNPTYYGNVRLGREIYNIRIGPFITPSWGNHFNGSLSAYVDPKPVNATPEPSGLLLGGLSLAFGVPFWWRRRRSLPGLPVCCDGIPDSTEAKQEERLSFGPGAIHRQALRRRFRAVSR